MTRVTHPVRGAVAGLLVGIGQAVVLVSSRVLTYGTSMFLVVVGTSTGVGILWGCFGPTRTRRGRVAEPPAEDSAIHDSTFWEGRLGRRTRAEPEAPPEPKPPPTPRVAPPPQPVAIAQPKAPPKPVEAPAAEIAPPEDGEPADGPPLIRWSAPRKVRDE